MYFRLSNSDVRPFMEAYEGKTLGSRLGGEKHLFFSLVEKVVGVVGEREGRTGLLPTPGKNLS